MPKRRQIPFLYWQRLADGTDAGYWKPSPQLRKAGWVNHALGVRKPLDGGVSELAVIEKALELNRQLAAWRAGAKGAPAAPPPPPRRLTFADLVDLYHASPEWDELAPATRRNYDTRLRQLSHWALDGALPIRQLDRKMVRDLKTGLLANDGSRFKAADTLRVLRLLLNYAIANEWLNENPTFKVAIPSTASRVDIILPAQVAALDAAATAAGDPVLGLGFTVGLWSLQRQADLLGLNRMSWREFENVDPADAAVLAGRSGPTAGRVMGFRLQQNKTRKRTGGWVDCPMPPWLHDRIVAAFERSQWLLPDERDPTRVLPQHLLQRRSRALLAAHGHAGKQFRDLRRSGMSMMRDLGVADATPISGHAILGRRSVLDIYMPANTRAACAAMAQALRTLAAREAREASR